ncbi:MAG: hypothetical protein IT529_02820 [Burkholderiales bacterium]|nr:hypothetical protein [Burkholderiales bacterium]
MNRGTARGAYVGARVPARAWPSLACGLLLAGCQLFQREPDTPSAVVRPDVPVEAPVEAPSPPPRRLSDTEALLAYHGRLRRLAAADLAREHDVARRAAGKAPTEHNRVRLAMIVSLPGTPFQDDTRALGLLDPVARNGESELSPIASLLSTHIQERRRLEASAQALQQKLDALRTLERSLIERKR